MIIYVDWLYKLLPCLLALGIHSQDSDTPCRSHVLSLFHGHFASHQTQDQLRFSRGPYAPVATVMSDPLIRQMVPKTIGEEPVELCVVKKVKASTSVLRIMKEW